jgi:UDP-N-acetylmuramyl pentapeptide phosphotransferase/UDP-N-acetylglucosamine-1-phosphate transferase
VQTELLCVLVLVGVLLGSSVTLKFAINSGIASRIAMDDPNHRSLHVSPTPRGGGLFFLPWVIVAGVVFGGNRLIVFLAVVLMFISLIDDKKGLPVGLRLGTHFLIAVAIVVTVPSQGWVILVPAVFFIVWVTNLFNFMDGSDGLAGAMAVFGFGSYAWAAWSAGQLVFAILPIALVAGALAFLIFNFPPAKIFLGDSGSIPVGFLAGALGFMGWCNELWPAWFPVFVFSPFIVDSTVNLLRRLLRRDRFWEPHREHAYQRLVRMGWSHGRLLRAETVLMASCAFAAVTLLEAGDTITVFVLTLFAALYLFLFMAIEAKWRAHVSDQ